MGKVSITVNGHAYDFTCDDGQEEHLREMAGLVDRRVQDLSRSIGQAGESRLLVMTALLLADELADAYRRLEGRGEVTPAQSEKTLSEVVRRLDRLAAKLQGA